MSFTFPRGERPLLLLLSLMTMAPPAVQILGGDTAPRWKAEYFGNTRFKGAPAAVISRELAIDMEAVGKVSRNPGVFSARWETVLQTRRPGIKSFMLSSTGGSRLFIDDVLVIDNWDHHDYRTRGAEVHLLPGPHRVRVEYFNKAGAPVISLCASFDDRRPSMIHAKRLRLPAEEGRSGS